MLNLDYNATTPVLPEVFEKMAPYFTANCGNPSSAHQLGFTARHAVDEARVHIANIAGADVDAVFFTSSATEALNWVIASHSHRSNGHTRLAVTGVEHSAVLEAVRGRTAAAIDTIRVDTSGRLDLEHLDATLTTETSLACVMWANNETGVVFPIEDVARICRDRGVPLLVDAVQAAGKLAINVLELGIDYLVMSGHKIYGPKGIGALIAPVPDTLHPILRGGGQERGRRAGTENVPGIVGIGEAARLAAEARPQRMATTAALRDLLEREIIRRVPIASVNGVNSPRVSNTSNVHFDGVDADRLVAALDSAGVCVSSGSACHADTIRPSHVILAMTGSYERAMQSIRFSVSHLMGEQQIHEAIDIVVSTIARIAPHVRCL